MCKRSGLYGNLAEKGQFPHTHTQKKKKRHQALGPGLHETNFLPAGHTHSPHKWDISFLGYKATEHH
ncbi:hypothetical protein ACRRTK_002196 [Alexandromys fortis]